MKEYVIVVDSNILYINYNKNDFSKYDFNSGLKNVISIVNELKLKDDVRIIIPEIVWLEIKQHKKEKLNEIVKKIKESYIIPNVHIEVDDYDYEQQNDKIMNETLESYVDEGKIYKDMPINLNYGSIINRAINKTPPFEGINKQSDKGFKDAVLWESILSFKKQNKRENVILYSNDKMFNNSLKDEYMMEFNEHLQIVKSEEELRKYLSKLVDNKGVTFEKETDTYRKIRSYLLKIKLGRSAPSLGCQTLLQKC